MGAVVVVGSVNVDFVVRTERLPGPGETVTGGTFEQHQGGKGANGAVAAARMGVPARFVGAVGDDRYGEGAIEALRAEGVGVGGLAVLPGVATGAALIVVDKGGENQISVASGANASLTVAHVRGAIGGSLTSDDVVLLNLEIGDGPLGAAIGAASAVGARVVLNVAPARPTPDAWLAARPILVLNEGEASSLTGVGGAEGAAGALRERNGAPVIVTLGARGALLADEGVVRSLPGHQVAAADATGAGDAFCGALAAQLAERVPLESAAGVAMAAAALSVTVSGARAGMPSRAEVERFLRERGAS